MMRAATILLVEGGSAGLYSMATALAKAGLSVTTVNSGVEAMRWLQDGRPDLVVLDASSMRSNGVRTCRRLRKALPQTPIIHCRAAGADEDRSAKADIYLVRPYTARKLLNRIWTLLPADDLTEEIVRAGTLTYYCSKRSVEVEGQGERRLTPKLAQLLEEFLRHPNQILGRHTLMENVWKTSYFGDTRTLDVHIRWMREIIEVDPARPLLLRTVRGVGYIFAISPRDE
ncbi:MAG: response regulator transcription factor [Chloroflexota bacterium]|nr:MAG: response regulator transcription factor [Chloroflexota bacterium]